jgi:hypothetical protein
MRDHEQTQAAEAADRKPYSSPKLTEYGNVSSLTQGTFSIAGDSATGGNIAGT